MSITYPVKIKFTYDKSDLKKAEKDISPKGEKEKGKGGGGIGELLSKLGVIAALVAGLDQILQPILNILQILVFVAVAKLINRVVEIIDAFKALFQGDIVGFLKKLIGEDTFKWFQTLWYNIQDFATRIKPFAEMIWNNYIKPGWEIIKNVGTWLWETIIKPSWNFLLGVGSFIWDLIVSGFEIIVNFGIWIWEQIVKPSWEYLKKVGVWIWEKIIQPSFNFLKDAGLWIWEKVIEPAFNFLKDVGSWLWDQIIKPAFSFLMNIGDWIWDLIKNSVGSIFGGKEEGSRAFGGSIPKTGLYKLHAGETVSRGNSTTVNNTPNITINVQGGSVSDEIIDEIARKLTGTLNTYMRW